jgi:hypothetical protein
VFLPQIVATSVHGSNPSPATLKTPDRLFRRTNRGSTGSRRVRARTEVGDQIRTWEGTSRQLQRSGEWRDRSPRRSRWRIEGGKPPRGDCPPRSRGHNPPPGPTTALNGVAEGRDGGVSSVNQVGSSAAQPYTAVDDFTITFRTVEFGAEAAANRFIVPMTLISCIVRRDA